ncbi:phosphoribosylamine--glycine ligase [Virgibacillus profundi]|uniref:Phosphoribosylamine--glycine ligase n=1 Tax=Virgibacillus profundi TaxID=2024555 RepID=A0A2A2IAE1_9BACI|nr:phosphoribosylamine--glycine ligase [Virgibacillus profundi]PAV28013.1 phosphoribosylamine--glycine ligase [Virgibacillus profundi]PXY52191.1 phosphoribosylamine--glycine ligase [Virgibacillus profundi]
MNVLVVGRGGREHSIVMKLAESKQVTNLYAAPGNGGIQQHAVCAQIDEMDVDGLIDFAKNKAIDLTIVGPEAPLNEGIANRFQEAGLAVFAPTKEAALLEGSKSFAKEFMKKYDIPTADYATFTSPADANRYIEEKGAPIVIKADGLAAGKGVVVAETKEEALNAVDEMLVSKAFAEAGATIVIEEFLAGKEFSLMAFVHENNVYPMVTARDHKRAFDNDEGPNTGGMGAFAPVPDVTEDDLAFAVDKILQKTADGMMEEGRAFTGILYAGLIMTEAGPRVIEFNTRFGDPETQVVLPLLENDLEQVFLDVLAGRDPALQWEQGFCTGVVVASKGYPGTYQKAVALPEMASSEDSFIVHAGTKLENELLMSDGGRVLLVGAKSDSLRDAADIVYRYLENLSAADAFFYRSDIGKL